MDRRGIWLYAQIIGERYSDNNINRQILIQYVGDEQGLYSECLTPSIHRNKRLRSARHWKLAGSSRNKGLSGGLDEERQEHYSDDDDDVKHVKSASCCLFSCCSGLCPSCQSDYEAVKGDDDGDDHGIHHLGEAEQANQTALHLASIHGHWQIVSSLQSAQQDQPDSEGYTPLARCLVEIQKLKKAKGLLLPYCVLCLFFFSLFLVCSSVSCSFSFLSSLLSSFSFTYRRYEQRGSPHQERPRR
jgi:hypothetical protein